MATKQKFPEAQNPLILRCHRLMEAFAKSDDERDFYLDRVEGFIVYVDLDKSEEDLVSLEKELDANSGRYVSIPKMTFYETKKIMEGFVNEKVYDIDTKEKLLELIGSKEARENFLDFIFDQHAELEKWQQYYQERSRVRIIEWLRQNHFEFVFEEDLDLPKDVAEKVKQQLFDSKPSKEVVTARKALVAKAKTYYSNEALNPRPKRGRPPKQVAKTEIEPQMTGDMYTTATRSIRPFLFVPEYGASTLSLFSQKFESEEDLLARRKPLLSGELGVHIETLNQKLNEIRSLSNRWEEEEKAVKLKIPFHPHHEQHLDEVSDEEEDSIHINNKKSLNNKNKNKEKAAPPSKKSAPSKPKSSPPKKSPPKKTPPSKGVKAAVSRKPVQKNPAPKKPLKKPAPAKKGKR